MRKAAFLGLAMLLAQTGVAAAEMLVAARTIRAHSVIMAQDLATQPGDAAGFASSPEQLIGQETRVALYAGRPIRLSDVGPPAVIERNQIVPLVFNHGGLRITTEGRSLSRAGAGDWVRVMNLVSRATVSGRAADDGRVYVSP